MPNELMQKWNAAAAWLGGPSFRQDVTIAALDGVITSIESGRDDRADLLDGIVLPGLVNAHSHAFHRLLRGNTHRQGGDFWAWRDRMYELADVLTPESYQSLATAVYIEMALAGVTAVGEFHYLHHQRRGTPYEDPNEMGHALIRAARSAGLRIGLLDAGYFAAGFDERALHPVQERFRDESPQAWIERAGELAAAYEDEDDVVIGLAPHSVRAVPVNGLRLVAERSREMPVHIHTSEQPAENRECLEATGLTPTGLLAHTGVLAARTTLVHATHLTSDDIDRIGSAGSGVCYCATTERDLADGMGPAAGLARAGAMLSVGSDSHAAIDIFEEARGIEMHARLSSGHRGIFSPESLIAAATTGGSKSLGLHAAGLAVGAPADFIVIDPDSPRLAGLSLTPDSIVFAASASDVTETFVAGRRIVSDGRHDGWEDARHTYDQYMLE